MRKGEHLAAFPLLAQTNRQPYWQPLNFSDTM